MKTLDRIFWLAVGAAAIYLVENKRPKIIVADFQKANDRLRRARDKNHELGAENAKLAKLLANSVSVNEHRAIQEKYNELQQRYSDVMQSKAQEIDNARSGAEQSERMRQNHIRMVTELLEKNEMPPRDKLAAIVGRIDLAAWPVGNDEEFEDDQFDV